MSDLEWTFAQEDPSQELAKLHHFSIKKNQQDDTIEFIVTVYEYAESNSQNMRFFARADKQVNQKTAPVAPFGWGTTLLGALGECVRIIQRFPYEA